MTIRDYIKKNGWRVEVTGPLDRYQIVHILFLNENKCEDEVSFDVKGAATVSGMEELEGLWKDFCKENLYKENSILEISIVAAAPTKKELYKYEISKM